MWLPVQHIDVLLRTKSVNNDRISREVDAIVMDIIKSDVSMLENVHQQVEMAEILEDFLTEYAATEPSLQTFEVICDSRNNTKQDYEDGKVHLSVRYQQLNCLNVTELAYQLTF